MAEIRHRVGIAASPHDVYESLTTLDGLRGWWTRDTQGDPTPGGKLDFSFGAKNRVATMEVVSTRLDESVTWRCVSGPDEWLDTTFTFDLVSEPDETVMLFTNAGWREPVEFMGHCTSKWGSYFLDMKAGLEGGQARPFPDDLHISGWD